MRPVKSYPNTPQRLSDPRSEKIDFVELRESTEGLFAERENGIILDDREARETLVIALKTSERMFDFALKLARFRKKIGGKGMVTCVDKSNVLQSLFFFENF